MKLAEMRNKSADELRTSVLDLRRELVNLRFQKTNAQLQNTSRFRTCRKQIARVKTVLRERQLSGSRN